VDQWGGEAGLAEALRATGAAPAQRAPEYRPEGRTRRPWPVQEGFNPP
jgi:hypothetical protein